MFVIFTVLFIIACVVYSYMSNFIIVRSINQQQSDRECVWHGR